ncbi:MAG: hypothetical protein ABI742_05280 [Gemmatimonadota bacterium]
MFSVVLYTQWKWARIPLLLLTLAGFALPVLSVRSQYDPGLPALALLERMQRLGPLYPVLALCVGLLVAMIIWMPDRAGRHVYALSLPLPRWKFVLLRYGAGVVLVLSPVLLLGIGALVATAVTQVPPGIHAYPGGITLRFLLATLVAFSIAFAAAAGTSRLTKVVIGVLALVIALEILLSLMGITGADPILKLLEWLASPTGPLDIFAGRWMLLDA